jgi:hypothetical protein
MHNSANVSLDQEALFGMINSFDVGTGEEAVNFNHYDYDNFEMSRYFAMPSDANLSIAPFVGPFTIGQSVGSMQDMRQPPTEATSPEASSFDLSSFMGGPSMDFGGESGNEASGSGLNSGAFYGSQFLSGGSPIVPNMSLHRRAASEDSRSTRFNGHGSFDARVFAEFNPGF